MSTVESKPVPTPDQIITALAEVSGKIAAMNVHNSFIINDYPIGGRNRGQCKLGVEYKNGHGYRTVKTTTNKHGRWCAPKKSTYVDFGVGVVVTGEGVERDAQWLSVALHGVYLRSASFDTTVLLNAMIDPYTRTEESHWTIGGVLRVLPKASDPEIEAVLVWRAGIKELIHTIFTRWKAAEENERLIA